MKSGIVADGAWRLRTWPQYRLRLRELRDSVRARYATELAEAGFFHRLALHWRLAAEYRQERRKIEPSSQALYSNAIAASSPTAE